MGEPSTCSLWSRSVFGELAMPLSKLVSHPSRTCLRHMPIRDHCNHWVMSIYGYITARTPLREY
jgi:F420-0:gamma-glutamyl ligase-like protein